MSKFLLQATRKIYLAILLIMVFGTSYSQISEVAVPFSISYKLNPIREFNVLPGFDKSKMIKEDENERLKGNKRHRFAKKIPVAFNPYSSGVWDITDEGKVWRLGLKSEDAYSLYIVFEKFKLNPGVKLFVYNEDASEFAGAFTSENNSDNNVFAIAPIPGEVLIVEMNIPYGVSDFGLLELTEVWHDYRNEFGKSKLKSGEGLSQSCNVDINCVTGTPWQVEKNAVCKLIAGGEMCTGSLLNNTAGTKVPYFFTAQHCIGTDQLAAGSVFYFNLEKPFCGASDGKPARTLSGSTLVATTAHKLDFSLVKLNRFPPIIYRPYLAGWDRSPNIPQSGVCIHHPNGDVKKISIEQHPLTTGNFGENYDTNSHWKVAHWEVGTTEGGSSGSPIFNSSHQIFGDLTGGDANCTNSVNDYFTKLSLSWSTYPDSANQLKVWLDPINLGVYSISGLDPYGFTDLMCDTSWNISKSEKLQISNSGLTSGWLSGQNSRNDSLFAEKFYAPTSIQLPGVFLNVAKSYNSNSFSFITIKIWKGDVLPTSEYYSKKYYIKYLQKNAINFVDFDSIVNLSGSFFVGYKVFYSTPADTFAVFQAANRGNTGTSTMYVNNGTWHNISDVTSPTIHSSLAIGLVGCNGLDPSLKVTENNRRLLQIYPNPCSDMTMVSFTGDLIGNPTCVDLMGRTIPIDFERIQTGLKLNLKNTSAGIYFLILNTKEGRWIGRFIIINN